MLRILLLFVLCFTASWVSAQRTVSTVPSRTVEINKPLVSQEKLVLDTIFPSIFRETCANSLFSYTPTGEEGFIFGSNSFFDLIKLQRFTYEGDDGLAVLEVAVAFAEFDAAIADTYVTAVVFADLNPDSTFGEFLGESDSIRVGDIRIDETGVLFTNFTFPDPAIVEGNSFLVGVDFTRTYASDSIGYVGILASEDGCGNGDNVFEIFPTQAGGLSFATVDDNWGGLNAEMFIGVVLDTDLNVSTRAPLADYATSVTPNPTSGLLNLTFTASGKQFSASLTDVTGREIRRQEIGRVSGETKVQWDLSDLPAGIYLYHLDGAEGRQSGKVMVR